jgi:hypothetical protein|tara:strand:- start:638 stop:871 length:234 start_codon:yes stop_codon:yes gene_type:complete
MSKNTNYLIHSPIDSLSPHGRGLTAAQFVVDNYAHRIDESTTMNMWVRGSQEVLNPARDTFVTPLEDITIKETRIQK